MNSDLPAKIYLPFTTNSCRNYYVLHIRVSEAKVFCTKTWAPYLCVFEVYRPEEIKFKNVDRIDRNPDYHAEEGQLGNGDIEAGGSAHHLKWSTLAP